MTLAEVEALVKAHALIDELLATIQGECPSLLRVESGASTKLADLLIDYETARAALPRERVLAPEWRELREDSWEDVRSVWLINKMDGLPEEWRVNTTSAIRMGFDHWQPRLIQPRIYADEAQGEA